MVLALHAITGAALASGGKNVGEAIILGLVSHYFLDSIPHIEYKIPKITDGEVRSAGKDFIKILIDLIIGGVVIFYFLQNKSFDGIILALIGGFFGLFPDGLVFLNYCTKDKNKNFFTKFLDNHAKIHKKIHSGIKNKIINVFSELIIIFIVIYIVYTVS